MNQQYVNELLDCDKLVIGSPVNNLSISTLIKNWIDHIVIPGKSFMMQNGKIVGLLTNLKVQILITKGGDINQMDVHSVGYLKDAFLTLGAQVNEPVFVDQTDRKINANLSPTQIIAKHHDKIMNALKTF
ncbi:NAD(P)H-dependent oxidoreductase [bacterium]|nr:NAD(P)H-dependent oxidoreductase [bacterium]